ncbi:MAG: hypothetical protein ACKVU4_00765 [Phycisphaerales bacterium]
MSATPRRFVQGFATGVTATVLLGGVCGAVLWTANRPRIASGHPPPMSREMRGVVQAMVTWSQNEGATGAKPAPNWPQALLQAGYIPAEFLQHPDPKFRHVMPFIFLEPSEEPRWSNSFNSTVPLVMQNPATTDGRGGLIAYNDNHVDFIAEPRFSELVTALMQAGSAAGGFPKNEP